MQIINKLELFEKVVTKAHDAIVITEAAPIEAPGPRIVFVNKAFCEMTGYSEAEVIGKTPRILQGANTDRKELDKIVTALRAWKQVKAELINYTKSGDEFWVELLIFPVANTDGKYTHWVAIQRDVTAKNAEIKKLKKGEERKANFIKMVSHELKTPITSIKGYVQLIQDHISTNGEQPVGNLLIKLPLERIDKQIDRLTRMIADMLELTKIEEGKLQLNKERLCLNDIVIETVDDLQYTSRTHKIYVYADSVFHIYADKNRIQQVLINFINNAIKYSPGKTAVDIHIGSKAPGFVDVSIKDYGIGINKTEYSKIFERFYRINDSVQNRVSGFGIGLFICQEIVEKHDGYTTIESEPGKGSTFTFFLPRAMYI